MAKVTENDITRGISGALTKDLIFRKNNGGDTVVYKKPKKTAPPTEKQKEVMKRFSMAADYAKAELSDPLQNAEYTAFALEKGIRNLNRFLMSDYLNAPEVQEVDTAAYTGKVGDKILIKAVDEYKVIAVEVEIIRPDGSILETGQAIGTVRFMNWEYSAKTANASFIGCTIKVTATGKPGNTGSLEKVI